ncbi:hypothetical protein BC940DRAFT_299897 [Gongronella butleri]|nr:hypothetical protein BC940DRAFT_299897 [Gongronella butleri]
MQDFANHYFTCNPLLTDGPDPIYAVAFSILLLHTDAHNKNVKRKMNKDTFINRTRVIEGGDTVPSEILDIMYDNIISCEFTRIDAQQPQDKNLLWFSKKTTNALVQDLYPRLDQLMPANNPYAFKRTSGAKPIPLTTIHACIDHALPLALAGVRTRQAPRPSSATSNSTALSASSLSPSSSSSVYATRVYKAGMLDRKYDLGIGGKRTTTRGWRPCGMILNGSQLMFFGDLSTFQAWLDQSTTTTIPLNTKDDDETTPTSASSTPPASPLGNAQQMSLQPTRLNTANANYTTNASSSSSSLVSPTASSIMTHTATTVTLSSSTSLASPASSLLSSSTSSLASLHLRPVQIVSLLDAVCLYDESYQKYPHVFRLMTADGQQFLFRGENADQVDDWVHKINYVAAVKTTGVRFTRPPQWQPKRESKAKAKILQLSEAWMDAQKQLAKETQLRHQLLVQLPLQKQTKERIVQFGDAVGRRLMELRIKVRRLECYREFVERELVVYHQQWHQWQAQTQRIHQQPQNSLMRPQLHATSSSSSSSSSISSATAASSPPIGQQHHRMHHPMRKFSSPLPFYANLYQLRLPPTTPSSTAQNVTNDASKRENDAENDNDDAPPTIPRRTSSLLLPTLPFAPTTSTSTPLIHTTPSSPPPAASAPPSTTQLPANDAKKNKKAPLPTLDTAPSPSNEDDDGFVIVTPRILEIQRRRRSQSNPQSPKSPASMLHDLDDNDDDEDDGQFPLLYPTHSKKGHDRSTSDVAITTDDDDDFSVIVQSSAA